MLPSGKFPRFATALALLVGAFLFVNLAAVQSPARSLLYSNSLDLAMVLLAAICSIYVARRTTGYLRQLWILLASALGLESIAQGIATYYQSFVPQATQILWPSDVLFFVWAAPAVMMFLPYAAQETPAFDWLRLLDFAQVAIVAATAYLYFFYAPYLWKIEGIKLVHAMLGLYVTRDVTLFLAFLLRSRTFGSPALRGFFTAMAMMFLATGIANTVYFLTLQSLPGRAGWADVLWALPYLFVVIFAVTRQYQEQELRPARSSRFGDMMVTHILPVAMPLLVILLARAVARQLFSLGWLAVTFSVLCSSVRLVLANRRQRAIALSLLTTEKALRQSEQLISTAFRASPDAFGINRFPNGPFLEVNEGFARLTGYSREETVGKSPTEMNLWVDPDARARLLAPLAETGSVRDVEFRFRHKDGRILTGLMSAALLDVDGQRCSLVVVRDITARKQAEEILRTSEERFRSLIENLHIGVVTYDPAGRIVFANQAALDLFDWTLDEIAGKTTFELGMKALWPDGTRVPDALRPVPTVIATRHPIRSQVMGWRLARRPGITWTLLDAIPEYNAIGELTRIIVTATDLTEQRRATEALRESEKRFRTLVENLQVGIIIYDPQVRVVFANQAVQAAFGSQHQPYLGKTTEELGNIILREDGTELPPEARPVPIALATKKPVRSQVIGVRHRSSPQIVWTLVDAIPEIDSTGAISRVVVSVTDLTELRRATEALRVSEERFRTLVENLHVAVVLHRPDGRVEYANAAMLRLFGLPMDSSSIGKLPAELGVVTLNEEGKELSYDERPVTTVIRTHKPVRNVTVGFRHPRSREPIWVFGSSVPHLDNQGNLLHVITSFSDITEQRRAAEALRESEERFRTLVRDLHVAVVLQTPDGRVEFANTAAYQMFHLPATTPAGKLPADYGVFPLTEDGKDIPDEDRPVYVVLRTRKPIENQVFGVRRSGSDDIVWVYGNAVPQFDAAGNVIRVISAYSDITEMRNAQRAVQQLSTDLLKLQDEERRRIGRELHDGLAQTVLAINLSLAQARQSIDPVDVTAGRSIEKARGLTQQLSSEIRTLSYLLHPPLLDDLGLVSAIKEYAQGFSERSGIDTQVIVASAFDRLPQPVETALFRIVQESLANIQRHSGSSSANIRLLQEDSSIILEITDFGRGLALASNGSPSPGEARFGVGIPGMRERMALIGGHLEIISNSIGTTVRATIPLSQGVAGQEPAHAS